MNATNMDSSEFVIGKLIGEGDFSKVYLCKKKDGNKEKYAMKVIKSSELGIKSYICETEKLSKVKNDNIIKWIKSEINGEFHCIITEYFPGKTLKYVIQSLKRPLTRDEILPIFTPLMSALSYLHSLNIYHLDVDLVNIMIKFGKSKQIEAVKLIDFGLPDSASNEMMLFFTDGDMRFVEDGDKVDIRLSAYVLLKMIYGTCSTQLINEKIVRVPPEQLRLELNQLNLLFATLICGMVFQIPCRFTSHRVVGLLEEYKKYLHE